MESPIQPELVPFNGQEVVADLQWLIRECDDRCIIDGTKWAAEILCYLPAQWISDLEQSDDMIFRDESIATRLSAVNRFAVLARSLLLARDYYRAEFYFDKARKLDETYTFLYFWTRYLKAVNDGLESEIESIERKAADVIDDDELMAKLYNDLSRESNQTQFDCFMHYLMGMVQRSLHLPERAKDSFANSIRSDVRFWPSWDELATLVEDADEVISSASMAPNMWMTGMFEMKALPRFHLYSSTISKAEQMANRGLGTQPALLVVNAKCNNLLYEHDVAIDRFQQAHELDPYRIEEMNLFSDSLYIRMDRVRLASLAHSFFRTHKYTWEACCIVANFYSIRGEHETSIRFLHRSLRINPNSSSSTWTLIGHEFMELKNNSAACMSYRRAIEKDPSDHRGWYGLGQLYDILKMNNYALFYYQQAHKCKPQDSRMLVALAEVYQKVGRSHDAEKALIKAYKVGDVEGTALLHLAKFYDGGQMKENASCAYTKYLEEYQASASTDTNVPNALLYLAKFHCETSDFDLATSYAQRCLEFDLIRHEGGSILRSIQEKMKQHKAAMSPKSMPITPTMRRLDLVADVSLAEDNLEEEPMAVSDGEDDESF